MAINVDRDIFEPTRLAIEAYNKNKNNCLCSYCKTNSGFSKTTNSCNRCGAPKENNSSQTLPQKEEEPFEKVVALFKSGPSVVKRRVPPLACPPLPQMRLE